MADPFDSMISGGASSALFGASRLFGERRAQNAALADAQAARDQNMLQFTLGLAAQERQAQREQSQFALQSRTADMELAASREENAFARLNSILDRQLKVAEIESRDRQQAFENTLKAMAFDVQRRQSVALIKQTELETRRIEAQEEFQELLPTLDSLRATMESGDSESKVNAATEYRLLVQKRARAIGAAPPEMRRMIGETAAYAAGFAKPLFKILDDASPNVDPNATLEFLRRADFSDGLDADEMQIGASLLAGLRGKNQNESLADYRAVVLNHLNGVFGPAEGAQSVAAEEFMANAFRTADSAAKFADLVGRGAFYRPLTSDEILAVRVRRAELEEDARKQDAVLRENGLASSPEAGAFVANRELEHSRALKEFAMRLKGVRDPEAVAHSEGANVVTVDGMMNAVLANRVPQYAGGKLTRAAAVVTGGLLAKPSFGTSTMVPGAVYAYNLHNMKTAFSRFKQEFPGAVRSNPALLHDPEFMGRWEQRVDDIAAELGPYFDANVVREQLSYGKNLPSWVVADRDLVAFAARVVPGYADSTGRIASMESPTAALGRYFRSQYSLRQRRADDEMSLAALSSYRRPDGGGVAQPMEAASYFNAE